MSASTQFFWIIIIVVVIVSIFVVVAAVKYQSRKRKEREAALKIVAEQLGATLVAGTFFKQPKLQFEYRGYPTSIEFYSTGGKHPTLYTRLLFNLSTHPAFEVRLYPERFFSKLGKLLGGQDIQIGEEQFDPKFMIKGSSEQLVKSMLSAEVREAIFELRALTMNDHIDISTQKYGLRIQKLSWLHAPDLLMSFVGLGQQVFDGYLAAVGAGSPSDSPSDSTAPVETQQECAVCGDTISGSCQNCPECKAAHHPECYELNDGCGRCS